MDEVFRPENCISLITITKTAGQTAELVPGVSDFVLFYAKNRASCKFRRPYRLKSLTDDQSGVYRCVLDNNFNVQRFNDEQLHSYVQNNGDREIFRLDKITSQRPPGSFPVNMKGRIFGPGRGYWKTGEIGMKRL
jgi:adenine-specific DNA-methyltransferase